MRPASDGMASLVALSERIASAAGDLLRERFGRPASGVGSKSSATDLVSDADRDAEALILDLLRRERPDDAVLAEEGGEHAGPGGLRWVVDPLDGTVNYLFGIPTWAVSIACEDEEGLLVAVVFDPMRRETFRASRGEGAWLGERRLLVRDGSQLEEALISTGFSYDADRRRGQAALLESVLPRVRDIRRGGSAALDLAWVAAGRVDAFYEHGLAAWDRAGGELLVREAGGDVVDLPATRELPPGVLAGSPAIVDQMGPLVGSAA